MKFLRHVIASLATLVAFNAGAAAPEAETASLYSFADLYRLSVTGAVPPELASPAPMPDAALRTVSGGAQPALQPFAISAPQFAQVAPFVFSISPVPAPERWLLVLAGLALAGWLARRRLGYSFHA